MKENLEQKLSVYEDDSCMEVPDSDGEIMPGNNYEFNTNKLVNVSVSSAPKIV
jgi:hypothetical protein